MKSIIIHNIVDNNISSNLYKLLLIALTVPISYVSRERSFSVMRWIKNLTRNFGFTNLPIHHIERDLSNAIESENVLNIFKENTDVDVLFNSLILIV